MRTQPRLRRFIPALAIAALLACVSADAFAQETRKANPAVGTEGRAEATPSPVYDLEIKDGLLVWTGNPRKDNAKQVPANLANVVELLREFYPGANFAVSPGLVDTLIADMKMRWSTVEEKLEAIRIASGSAFVWRNAQVPSIDPVTGLPATPTAAIPGVRPIPALYVLEPPSAEAKPGLQVEAFNIGGYVDSMNEEEMKDKETRERRNAEKRDRIQQIVLETVDEYEIVSRRANPKAKPLQRPSIRFHPGANLLIVIGEPEVVAVAAKVIGALPGAQRSVAAGTMGAGAAGARDGARSYRESIANEVLKKARPDGGRPAPPH